MGISSRFSNLFRRRHHRHPLFLALLLAGTTIVSSMPPDPPDKTVRVFYIRPTDVAENPGYATGIASVMKDAQKYYLAQCKFTFQLNNPVVEVVKGSHPRSWYENNPNGDAHWRTVYNAQDDLFNLVPSLKADASRKRWKVVYYIDAKGNGGGGGGVVLLPKHDADGALIYPKETARWVGGMSHELGHCFGLPDAASTDGTVMSASFYSWPNCTITSGMTTTMKNLGSNAGFWFPSITTGIATLSQPYSWSPRFSGNDLRVDIPLLKPVLATVSLYDLAGKRKARLSPGSKDIGSNGLSFDVGRLDAGNYIVSLEESGKVVGTRMIRKAE